jgi:hypothetical protein
MWNLDLKMKDMKVEVGLLWRRETREGNGAVKMIEV